MIDYQTCWPPLVIIERDGLEGYPPPRTTFVLSEAHRERNRLAMRNRRLEAKRREISIAREVEAC